MNNVFDWQVRGTGQCAADLTLPVSCDDNRLYSKVCRCLMDKFLVRGCTDAQASNYDSDAVTDDGSCTYVLGCMDAQAENYDSDAVRDDGSCTYVRGCTDAGALNYNSAATKDDGTCTYRHT